MNLRPLLVVPTRASFRAEQALVLSKNLPESVSVDKEPRSRVILGENDGN